MNEISDEAVCLNTFRSFQSTQATLTQIQCSTVSWIPNSSFNDFFFQFPIMIRFRIFYCSSKYLPGPFHIIMWKSSEKIWISKMFVTIIPLGILLGLEQSHKHCTCMHSEFNFPKCKIHSGCGANRENSWFRVNGKWMFQRTKTIEFRHQLLL